MCLHIFHSGATLHVDYAAETITLCKGASIDLFDILLTNHAARSVDRIHVVYPHAVRARLKNDRGGPSFIDLTHSWLDPKSPYNDFYGTPDAELAVTPMDGWSKLTLKLIDPSDICQQVGYDGCIRGRQDLVPYEVANGEQLTADEWRILGWLGWSVFTVKFSHPIPPNEARWLRFRGQTGMLRQNRRLWVERQFGRLTGQLTDDFEIAGPVDVTHRLLSGLRAASLFREATAGAKHSALMLQELQDKLIVRGLQAPNTTTVVKDWRINVFTHKYRRTDEPLVWGDIRPCGPGVNLVCRRSGQWERALQWKAGEKSIPQPLAAGQFGARIRAHDIPLWVSLLPLVSLLIALLALFSRPDVYRWLRRLIP